MLQVRQRELQRGDGDSVMLSGNIRGQPKLRYSLNKGIRASTPAIDFMVVPALIFHPEDAHVMGEPLFEPGRPRVFKEAQAAHPRVDFGVGFGLVIGKFLGGPAVTVRGGGARARPLRNGKKSRISWPASTMSGHQGQST